MWYCRQRRRTNRARDPDDLRFAQAASAFSAGLLEEPHPLRRLGIVCRMLTREAGFLGMLRAVPAPPADLTEPASMN